MHDKYGESIWRFITTQWRPWWIRILQYKFPNIFGSITIGQPTAAFKDKKNEIDTCKTDINTYLLSRLALSSNTYLLPTVKYPWRCSEFQHKVGYLPIDTVFQRYIQQCKFEFVMKKNNLQLYKHFASALEEHIRDEGDGDIFCFNHK